jgi:hypothetical protein
MGLSSHPNIADKAPHDAAQAIPSLDKQKQKQQSTKPNFSKLGVSSSNVRRNFHVQICSSFTF